MINQHASKIPDNYEIFFSQINCNYSIWYVEPPNAKPELMVGGFDTKEDAVAYLLNL